MNRFLTHILMPVATLFLLLPAGCNNKLPTSTAVASSSPSTAHQLGYTQTGYWEIYNSATGDYLDEPWGVAIVNGNLFVADATYNTITEMSPNGQPNNQVNGAFIKQFSNLPLNSPWGLAVDTQNNIYIADTGNYRILKIDANGNFKGSYGSYGTSGKNAQFEAPYNVTVDSQGNIYVLDYYTGLQKLDPNGNYLLSWGGNTFSYSYGLATDGENIYVADRGNARVDKFNSKGQLLGYLGGQSGSGKGQLSYPYNLTVDSKGNIFVTDRYNGILKFSSSMAFQTYVANAGEFYTQPYAITTDPQGNVYVGDNSEFYMYKFTPNH